MADRLTREEIRERAPRVELKVEALMPYIEMEDGSKQGFTVLRIPSTDVMDGSGEKIGEVGGGTGYVVISRYEDGGDEWLISHEDLWYTLESALEAKE